MSVKTNIIMLVVIAVTVVIAVLDSKGFEQKLTASGSKVMELVGALFHFVAMSARIIFFAVLIYYLAFSGLFDGIINKVNL